MQHGVLAGLQLVGRLDVGHVVELDLLVVLDHQAGLGDAIALVGQVRLEGPSTTGSGASSTGRLRVGLRQVVGREVLVRLVGHVVLP